MTCRGGLLPLYTAQALFELPLGSSQLGEGRAEVLDLLVELLLDGAQLLRREAVQID